MRLKSLIGDSPHYEGDMQFGFNLRALWPEPVAPPFARECEDIWGLPNSLQNSPWRNLSVLEHARVKYGNHVYKHQTRARQKSDRYCVRPVRGHDEV